MPKLKHVEHTLEVSEEWRLSTEIDRVSKIEELLALHSEYDGIDVASAFANGHITLRIEHQIPADTRGLFLIELENRIKDKVESGATIWLEPVGDKSKLRQLRGVDIKAN